MEFHLSRHAREEMLRRGIPRELLDTLLNAPQQRVPAHGGRTAYQSQFDLGGGKVFLVRAVVDDRVRPAVVVTVYRTTKIGKYWRQP